MPILTLMEYYRHEIGFLTQFNYEWYGKLIEFYDRPFDSTLLYSTLPNPDETFDAVILDKDSLDLYTETKETYEAEMHNRMFKHTKYDPSEDLTTLNKVGDWVRFELEATVGLIIRLYNYEADIKYTFPCPLTIGKFIEYCEDVGIRLYWSDKAEEELEKFKPKLT